jgi:hypothetical protein
MATLPRLGEIPGWRADVLYLALTWMLGSLSVP